MQAWHASGSAGDGLPALSARRSLRMVWRAAQPCSRWLGAAQRAPFGLAQRRCGFLCLVGTSGSAFFRRAGNALQFVDAGRGQSLHQCQEIGADQALRAAQQHRHRGGRCVPCVIRADLFPPPLHIIRAGDLAAAARRPSLPATRRSRLRRQRSSASAVSQSGSSATMTLSPSVRVARMANSRSRRRNAGRIPDPVGTGRRRRAASAGFLGNCRLAGHDLQPESRGEAAAGRSLGAADRVRVAGIAGRLLVVGQPQAGADQAKGAIRGAADR